MCTSTTGRPRHRTCFLCLPSAELADNKAIDPDREACALQTTSTTGEHLQTQRRRRRDRAWHPWSKQRGKPLNRSSSLRQDVELGFSRGYGVGLGVRMYEPPLYFIDK